MSESAERGVDFDKESKIMDMFSSSAKSFNQLSSVAMAVTIVFSEKVLGDKVPIDATENLIWTWVLFLISIGCGMFYQYFAVKFLENKHAGGYVHIKFYPRFLVDSPGIIYGAMMLFFLLGGIMLVFTAHQGLQ